MSKIGLTKTSFMIQCRSLDNKRELRIVRGETLYYKERKLGIYRREHAGSKRQKYEYVLVDLATGLGIAIRARKTYLIEDMERGRCEYLRRYEEFVNSEFYKKQVEELQKLKNGGSTNGKEKVLCNT